MWHCKYILYYLSQYFKMRIEMSRLEEESRKTWKTTFCVLAG
jgi:hypothetical protein